MTEQLDVDIAAGSEQFSEEVDRYDGAMNSAFRERLYFVQMMNSVVKYIILMLCIA